MRPWVNFAFLDGCGKNSNFQEAISQPCLTFAYSCLTNHLCQIFGAGVSTRKIADIRE
jgi:hypothetical protein